MTVNEAIERCDKLINGYSVNYSVSYAFSENGEPYPAFRVMAEFAETCKKALEEIQAYRAIGTVEQLQFMKSVSEMSDDMLKSLADSIRARMKYEAIGTVEEFKELKDGSIPIIHGKAELELHDREIRAKAIDEFAERLNQKNYDGKLSCFGWHEFIDKEIDEIAEQMKGEQNG